MPTAPRSRAAALRYKKSKIKQIVLAYRHPDYAIVAAAAEAAHQPVATFIKDAVRQRIQRDQQQPPEEAAPAPDA